MNRWRMVGYVVGGLIGWLFAVIALGATQPYGGLCFVIGIAYVCAMETLLGRVSR